MREFVDDGLVDLEPFDRLVENFKAIGMSEACARVAAIGRDGSEHEARRRWAEAQQVSEAALEGFR